MSIFRVWGGSAPPQSLRSLHGRCGVNQPHSFFMIFCYGSIAAQRKRKNITKKVHFVLTTPPYDHHALSYWCPSINESRSDLRLLQKQHGFLDFNSLGWSKGVAHNVTQGTLKDWSNAVQPSLTCNQQHQTKAHACRDGRYQSICICNARLVPGMVSYTPPSKSLASHFLTIQLQSPL